MNFLKLTFAPGINRDGTNYSAQGTWWDCDKIRFGNGLPETIGGWRKYTSTTFLGSARSLYSWATLSNQNLIGIGTHLKYYIENGGSPNDITPIRATSGAGDATFAVTDGSATATVTDTAHGASMGDFVTFSGAASLGGNVVAGELNKEFQIVSIVDADNYTITLGVTANSSDVGDGGASTVAEYQIAVGLDSAVFGDGWGSDPWGDGGWGEAGSVILSQNVVRIWSHDNFGEDLIINPRGGGIYYWDASLGISSRAVEIGTMAGADSTPQVANRIIVSDVDRHVIAFGCDDEFNPGVQDPLLIRFSDQENAVDWHTATTNTAGSLRVSSGVQIVTAIQTKREILVFTDKSVYSMQYLGPPYTFGISEIAGETSVVSPEAVTTAHDVVYWMAPGKFMRYDGTVQEVPCTVQDYVFDDINLDNISKVVAGHNVAFSEVWWFYPTAASTENDRYVVYDYVQGVWYFGTMTRTSWLNRGAYSKPIAAATDGYLYTHEDDLDDGEVNPPIGLSAYIQSADREISDGYQFIYADQMIPDISFGRSTVSNPTATITVKAREFPGDIYEQSDDEDVTQTSTSPVDQYTRQIFPRIRGRAISLRIESDEIGTSWKLGYPRLSIRTDGRR